MVFTHHRGGDAVFRRKTQHYGTVGLHEEKITIAITVKFSCSPQGSFGQIQLVGDGVSKGVEGVHISVNRIVDFSIVFECFLRIYHSRINRQRSIGVQHHILIMVAGQFKEEKFSLIGVGTQLFHGHIKCPTISNQISVYGAVMAVELRIEIYGNTRTVQCNRTIRGSYFLRIGLGEDSATRHRLGRSESAVFKEFGLGSLRFTFGGGFGRYFGGGLGYQRCAIVMCLLRKDCSIGTCA